jgi:hypothetical protein
VDRLVRLGFATKPLLIEARDQLAGYGIPFVCCFAQLPFALRVDKTVYSVPAAGEETGTDLYFAGDHLYLNGTGNGG